MAAFTAPPKPWERAGSSSGASPFRPSEPIGSTSAVVESAGVANNKNEISDAHLPNRTNVGRPMPPRPWERNPSQGYGPMTSYGQNSSYGGGLYGVGPSYGNNYGGLYGSNYRSGYGVGTYGGMYGGGYGMGNSYSGLYGGGYGMGGCYGAMGNYGMGLGGPLDHGNADPNNPFGGGPPTGPPTFWQAMLRVMHGVVSFFGRVAILVDQNTQAFHLFITALLQLCDRAGLLYGELARFVLRLFGFPVEKKLQPNNATMRTLPGQGSSESYYVEEPKDGNGAWDNVWSDENLKAVNLSK